MAGKKAISVDLVSSAKEGGQESKRILGVIIPLRDQTWFVKMMGRPLSSRSRRKPLTSSSSLCSWTEEAMDNTDIQTSLPRQKETENRILLDSLPETSVQRRGPVWQVLWFLASLKITVVLLALCMVLVFASTLAQIDASNWKVVNTFFGLRSFLIWIPFQDFVNLYNRELKVSGAFPFPGGMTLGILLLVNLLAAHAVRFQLKWHVLGILILHAGLILLLLGELETRTFAVEGTMAIDEGSSSSVVLQSHNLELAIASPSEDADFDDVVSVPASLLQRDHLIHDEMLPFDIDVVRVHGQLRLVAEHRRRRFSTSHGRRGFEVGRGSGTGSQRHRPGRECALGLPDFQNPSRPGPGHLAGDSPQDPTAAAAV